MKKLRLMRGYDVDKPKVELGILEYHDDKQVYVFTYSEIDKTLGVISRFWEVPGIPRENKVTESKKLFRFFKDRIPPLNRGDFPEILEWLGLDEYDEWKFLEASGLRLETDKFELIKFEE